MDSPASNVVPITSRANSVLSVALKESLEAHDLAPFIYRANQRLGRAEALVHTSEADATTQTAPPPKPKWAFARESFPCGRCGDVIGMGEAYRVSTNPRRFGLCEACSRAVDPEHGAMPAHIDDRSPLEELRDELELQQAGRRQRGDFARFTTPAARAAWKTQAVRKPSARMTFKPGSQPYEDPRGQGRNRHGVAAAVRDSIERDYRRAQAGERDE